MYHTVQKVYYQQQYDLTFDANCGKFYKAFLYDKNQQTAHEKFFMSLGQLSKGCQKLDVSLENKWFKDRSFRRNVTNKNFAPK